jgi:enoyl-CoA hydratase
MSEPKVLTERRGQRSSFHQPAEVRNCVDGATAALLFEAVETFKGDDSLNVMILTGVGTQAFCSGADLKNIATLNSRPGSRESGPMGISRITDLGKPTIAAVNGYSTAGGLELACWGDFRIASRDAQFGVLNRRWGVPLIDGGTQRLPRIVGLANALYLIETGVLISAEHAQRMGGWCRRSCRRARRWSARCTSRRRSQATRSRRCATTLAGARRDDSDGGEGLEFEMEAHRRSVTDPLMAEWLAKYARGERQRRYGRRSSARR